ncbi:MAG: hypothetical protein KDC98_02435 [Planctomycetes bacterium]|nr:hypothetical protein [Planctomycetota bacterium]
MLARDEGAAAEVQAIAAATRAAIGREIGRDPGRGLILALSAPDPLPIDGAEAYADAVSAWLEELTGDRASDSDGASSFGHEDGKPDLAFDPALPLHLLAAPVPGGEPRLDLPPALVELAAFVLILPTRSCLETTSEAVIEAAIAAERISRAEVWTASVLVGHPATLMSDELDRVNSVVLHQSWLRGLGLEPAQREAMLLRMGVKCEAPVEGEIRRDQD